MERAHLAAEYFFSVLLSIAADAEKRGCQRRNGILDGRLSKRQVGIYQKSRHCRVSGISQQYRLFRIESGKSIITNLQKFLMELGKGYAFVARQQHIHTEKQDYYIDLVFYNYILKCFVLIDLKTSKVSHQDVGQMDMYVRMYDELKRTEGDNPTIGIILCSDTDEDIARYSILKGNEQLFASKYKLYLPTEEELRNEIETQKMMFYLQYDLGGLENGNG